ncbi:hypothetical protein GGI43DRAFT_1475 [Trichoderma evansii]
MLLCRCYYKEYMIEYVVTTVLVSVGWLAASRQAGSIASCISVWLCCLYPPDALMRVSMFVPCRVFAVCPLALRLHRRQRERSKRPSALYRLPTVQSTQRTSCCCGVQHTRPRTSPVSFTIRLRHGNFACGLTKINQNFRFHSSSHTFGSLETH